MKNLLTAILLLIAARTIAQEEVYRIEISTWQMLGWINEPKQRDCYIIENGNLYEKKRGKLKLIGPCETLAALMDRQKIDAIFRGDETNCADGYEVNYRYTYYVLDRNVPTTYSYEYSVQTHCKNEADARYLHKVQEEFKKLAYPE